MSKVLPVMLSRVGQSLLFNGTELNESLMRLPCLYSKIQFRTFKLIVI